MDERKIELIELGEIMTEYAAAEGAQNLLVTIEN